MTGQKNQCQSCDLNPVLIHCEDNICGVNISIYGLATGPARLLPPSYAPIQSFSKFLQIAYAIFNLRWLHVVDI